MISWLVYLQVSIQSWFKVTPVGKTELDIFIVNTHTIAHYEGTKEANDKEKNNKLGEKEDEETNEKEGRLWTAE